MDTKLAQSIRRYRESLRLISSGHRQTMRLPTDLRECPIAQGKRMRLDKIPEPNEATAAPHNACAENNMAPPNEATAAPHNACTENNVTPPNIVTAAPHNWMGWHRSSLERLNEGIFLNDEVINVTLQLAYDALPEDRRQHVQLCDSFMYAQLTRGITVRNLTEVTASLQQNFARVNRYRRNRGPGAKAVTLVPICEDQHWFLVVILLSGDADDRQALLGVVDSYRSATRTHALNVLEWYLRHTGGPLRAVRETWDVATQANLYDCGVHLVHNATRFLAYLGSHTNIDANEATRAMNAAPCPISRQDIRRAEDPTTQAHPSQCQKPKCP